MAALIKLSALSKSPKYAGFASMWDIDVNWNLDSMAIGEHLGSVVKRTIDTEVRHRELALMGDPTLRLYRVRPPAAVQWNSGTRTLSWTAASNTCYYVFGSNNPLAPFTQLLTITTGNSYPNASPSFSSMVCAVKLIGTEKSGTYWEVSQGVVKP